jgi:hypothetical protein
MEPQRIQPQQPQQMPQMLPQQYSTNYVMPQQLQEATQAMASLVKLLVEISNSLIALRREFRGEALYQSEDGTSQWIQVSKPSFVRIDFKTGKPVKKIVNMPWNEKKEIYIPNDEAIDEILSMLKFAGVNQINPIGYNSEDNYQDDLREFECKLAGVLCLKQRDWGLDKEMLPMMQFKLKTIVQDARSLSVKGGTLKALQTTVQRVEQMIEGDKNIKKMASQMSPY